MSASEEDAFANGNGSVRLAVVETREMFLSKPTRKRKDVYGVYLCVFSIGEIQRTERHKESL